jgi:cytochrome c2
LVKRIVLKKLHGVRYYKSQPNVVDSTVPMSAPSFPPPSFASLLRIVSGALVLTCAALLGGCGDDDLRRPFVGGDAEIGKKLITQYQCGACHAIPGVPGAGGDAGPALERFGRLGYIAGGIPNVPPRLVAWLLDPPALKPGTAMPDLGLTEQEARHMAAFLYTLR